MAPIGTVVKNGIVFLLLTAGITRVAAGILATGIGSILTAYGLSGFTGDQETNGFDSGVTSLWLGLLILIGGTGLVYLKALSDTVEEGMIEF